MYDSHQQMCNPDLELGPKQWLNDVIVRRLAPCLTVVSTCLLGFVASCSSFGMLGGQSGDDGDFNDGKGDGPEGPVIEGPGGFPAPIPQDPNCNAAPVTVESDEPTSLELTPAELIAGIDPPNAPFHWMNYESQNLTASHSPGPGATALDLDLSLRTDPADLGPDETLAEWRPEETDGGVAGTCVPLVVVPVWVNVRTTDGALDERVKGTVSFNGVHIASLYARFSPDELNGDLDAGDPTSKDESITWSLDAYVLNATLWRGGSSGVFTPEFKATSREGVNGGSSPQGGPVAAPPPALPPNGTTPVPAVLEQREAFGLWPRLEECVPGFALDMDDAFMGRSLREMFESLDAHSSYPLAIETNLTSTSLASVELALTTEIPTGLVCVNVTQQLGTMSLDVSAHLAATEPSAVAISTDLRLSVTAHVDLTSPEAPFTRIAFERKVEDVATPVSRAIFQTEVGLDLSGVPEEYTQIWWSWFGSVSPQSDTASVTFLVTSPDAELTAHIEQQIAEGGPGFGIGIEEDAQVLPGDALLRAVSAP